MSESVSIPANLPQILRETASWCCGQTPDRTEAEYETIAWRLLIEAAKTSATIDDAVRSVRERMQDEFRRCDTPIVV